jgi:hypothetical protein
MPKTEDYIAEVTVSVRMKSTTAGVVAEYSVTRTAKGASHPIRGGSTTPDVPRVVDQAFVDATAAHRAMLAGVQNAEARRLK